MPERPSEVLARQVRVWREQRKLSAQALADRIAEDGGNLTRVAISKIENRDRGVTVDEWLQLAYALAVPPALLLLDLRAGSPVAIVPGAVVHPWLAWQWLTQEHPPPPAERRITRAEEFYTARGAIDLYRHENDAFDAAARAHRAVQAAEYAGDEARIREARAAFVEALTELAKWLDAMVQNGTSPPPLPQSIVEPMKTLGLLPTRTVRMFRTRTGSHERRDS